MITIITVTNLTTYIGLFNVGCVHMSNHCTPIPWTNIPGQNIVCTPHIFSWNGSWLKSPKHTGKSLGTTYIHISWFHNLISECGGLQRLIMYIICSFTVTWNVKKFQEIYYCWDSFLWTSPSTPNRVTVIKARHFQCHIMWCVHSTCHI